MNAVAGVLRDALPRTLAFLREMTDVSSGPGDAAGIHNVASLVSTRFASLGFQAIPVAAVNPVGGAHLILRRRGVPGGRGVCLDAHMDTVFSSDELIANRFEWREDGDRIYGPGVSDDKGGIAMIFAVLDALRVCDPESFSAADWTVALNAAEESMSPDFPGIVESHLPNQPRAVLVFEGATRNGAAFAMPVARKGSVNLRLTVRGRGAHGGGRHHEATVSVARDNLRSF